MQTKNSLIQGSIFPGSASTTPLLPAVRFKEVFEPLSGMAVSFHCGSGNVGDQLIHIATRQLLCIYNITVVTEREEAILYGGGGNMGYLYHDPRSLRIRLWKRATDFGIPLIILPQSWTSKDDTRFTKAFARERQSLKFCPEAHFAPDLALGYTLDFKLPAAVARVGQFFRADCERKIESPLGNMGDPIKFLRSHYAYIRLAAEYEEIHTDRLHFAISGLIAGRNVTLYPNSYHKNRAVWEAWLKDLGCKFSDTVQGIPSDSHSSVVGNLISHRTSKSDSAAKKGLEPASVKPLISDPHLSWQANDIVLCIMSVTRQPTYIFQTLSGLFLCDLLAHRLREICIIVGSDDTTFLNPIKHHPKIRVVPMTTDEWSDMNNFPVYRRGCFNFVRALKAPQSDYKGLLFCEEDVIFREGFIGKLLQTLNEMRLRKLENFVLSCYSPHDHEANKSLRRGQYFSSYYADSFYGTQSIFFPANETLSILKDIRLHGAECYEEPYDLLVKRYCVVKQHLYTTRFSIVQHISEQTTELRSSHQSPSFHCQWPE